MVVATSTRPLAGNRMVLVGSVLYLLEWVAIIGAGMQVPVGAEGSASDLTAAYEGHTTALAWAAGWFSVVLLGRVLLVVGLRAALADSGRPHRLMDFAVAAMLVGVVVEIAVYALTAGVAWSLENGGSAAAAQALDAGAFELNAMLFGPSGVAVACSAYAMGVSGLFPKALSGVGLAAGAALVLVGLAFTAPSLMSVSDWLTLAVLGVWVWMLLAGVLCWRAAPVRAHSLVDAS